MKKHCTNCIHLKKIPQGTTITKGNSEICFTSGESYKCELKGIKSLIMNGREEMYCTAYEEKREVKKG